MPLSPFSVLNTSWSLKLWLLQLPTLVSLVPKRVVVSKERRDFMAVSSKWGNKDSNCLETCGNQRALDWLSCRRQHFSLPSAATGVIFYVPSFSALVITAALWCLPRSLPPQCHLHSHSTLLHPGVFIFHFLFPRCLLITSESFCLSQILRRRPHFY